MHIQLESNELNSITSYTDHSIQINDQTFQSSLIISPHNIITDWAMQQSDLNLAGLAPLLELNPEIILIGCKAPKPSQTIQLQHQMHHKGKALEIMTIDAAIRTFNILLNEGRHVILGIIF